jgi:hypothetical protein
LRLFPSEWAQIVEEIFKTCTGTLGRRTRATGVGECDTRRRSNAWVHSSIRTAWKSIVKNCNVFLNRHRYPCNILKLALIQDAETNRSKMNCIRIGWSCWRFLKINITVRYAGAEIDHTRHTAWFPGSIRSSAQICSFCITWRARGDRKFDFFRYRYPVYRPYVVNKFPNGGTNVYTMGVALLRLRLKNWINEVLTNKPLRFAP